MNKQFKTYKITVFILLLGWMLMIFLLSAQNAEDSSETSGEVVSRFISFLFPNFDEFSAKTQENIMGIYQFFVRKVAHFTIFAILGVLSFLNTVSFKNMKLKFRALSALLFSMLYAVSDEIHQLLVPGRSGEIRDVLIDSLGAVSGILFVFIIIKFTKSGKIKKIYK